MELTPQQLKELDLEGFKDYSALDERPLVDIKYLMVVGSVSVDEMILRDCEAKLTNFNPSHIQRFGSAQDYDLHETKPYLDGSVQQIKRLIDCVSHVHIKVSKYARWQLSEAKLELINRN